MSTWREWEGKLPFNMKKPSAEPNSGRRRHLPRLVAVDGMETKTCCGKEPEISNNTWLNAEFV